MNHDKHMRLGASEVVVVEEVANAHTVVAVELFIAAVAIAP